MAAHAAPVRRQVEVEDAGNPRRRRQQAGAEPKQGRLAGTVRALEEHDLARVDVEIDAGERRKTAEKGDHPAEVDRGHEDNATDGWFPGAQPASSGPPGTAPACASTTPWFWPMMGP